MANDKKKEVSVDSVPWIVKATDGKRVVADSFNTYKEANTAARSFTRETGQFAQAVRS